MLTEMLNARLPRQVYKAEMAGSTEVAIKYVTKQSPRELRRFACEIGILKSLHHINIVQVPQETLLLY